MSTSARLFPLITSDDATGKVAEIYQHAQKDLGTVGLPLQALSRAPELLAPFWALLRESLLVGTFDERVAKEAVALTVSRANQCDYCTNAHGFLLHAADASHLAEELLAGNQPGDSELASVVDWARRTLIHGTYPASIRGPFDYRAGPRFVGTVLTFHFINRLITALTSDTFPAPASAGATARDTWSVIVRRELEPGLGVTLMDEPAGWARNGEYRAPEWAQESPVGPAWGRLKGVAELGGQLLGAETAARVSDVIQAHLDSPPNDPGWINHSVHAIDGDPDTIRVALLAGVEPARITDHDIEKLQENSGLSHHCVTFLVAYGAISATAHIEQTMVGASLSEAFNV